MAVDYLIDDEGEVWQGPDFALANRFRIKGNVDALTQFLTDRMGYIGVRIKPTRAIVKFNRETVSTQALSGLLYLLHEHGLKPTVFRHDEINSDAQVLRHRCSIVEYIGQCLSAKEARNRATRADVALEKSNFARRWAAGREVYLTVSDAAHRNRILQALFQGFYTIVKYDGEVGDYRLDSMGEAYRAYDRAFGYSRPGQTFRELSDQTYGNWVADSLLTHRSRGVAPRVELCTATIQLPEREPRQFRYERLVVPVHGTDVLLMASHML